MLTPSFQRAAATLMAAAAIMLCGMNAAATDRAENTQSENTYSESNRVENIRVDGPRASGIIPASHQAQVMRPTALTGLPAGDSFAGLYTMRADETPSGFQVPRFVSLKFGRVNARTGPSRNHSIAYQYRRRGLPLIVVAETEMWRKVRDMDGDEAWVRKPALSGERYALFSVDGDIQSKPDPQSPIVARAERGAQVKLEDCSDRQYCRIRTSNGLSGFSRKAVLWGSQAID